MTLKQSERNDCTVRTIADAFDVPYEKAHDICALYGRENGQGFYIQSEVLPKLNLTLLTEFINVRVSLALRTLDPDKTYICLVDGHIFAIKNSIPCEAVFDGQNLIVDEEMLKNWLKQFGHKKVVRMFEVPKDWNKNEK